MATGEKEGGIRVMSGELETWAGEILLQMGLPKEDAELVAACLVQVDLRGIFSHGTHRLASYVSQYRKGGLNPRPSVRVVREGPANVVLDGGGGLGYMVARRGTELMLEKAEETLLAVVSTHCHGHVGSLGIYARMALERGLVTFSVAGGRDWQAPIEAGENVWDAMQSPPICIGIPSASGPPLVIDMSANFFRDRKRLDEAILSFPEPVIKSLGLKFAATLLGGILAGGSDEPVGCGGYSGAVRGFLMLALKPDLVGEEERFLGEVTRVISASRELAPMPGQESAEVAGSLEWERERKWVEEGIPLGSGHREKLEDLAEDVGIPVPWEGL